MITRSALKWGAVKAPAANTNKGMVVHYDSANQRLAEKNCSACKSYWERTRTMHMKGNQWIDIGYAFGVCPHGEVYEGRGYGRVQAAAKQTSGKLPNGNDRWVNVTLMGGPDDPVPSAQIDAFLKLRDKLMREKGMGSDVKCHSDFTATSCPGNIARALVRNGTFSRMSDEVKEKDTVKPGDVWNHEIPVTWGTETNPEWQAESILVNTNQKVRELEAQVKELSSKIDALITLAS